MRRSRFYFPYTLPFVVGFFFLFFFLFFFVHVGLMGYAFEKMGIDPNYIFGLLFLSLLGSGVNIPVARLPAQNVRSDELIVFFGMRYVIPRIQPQPWTIIAVNVGGAVIPTGLSLYLVAKNGLYLPGLLGVAVVAAVVYRLARPVPGMGIAVPVFIPPLVAAATGILLSPAHSPALAYIAGTLGTLIGADILNLNKIRGLGAPIASIGGAGTFDGVFLTGMLAVLLA